MVRVWCNNLENDDDGDDKFFLKNPTAVSVVFANVNNKVRICSNNRNASDDLFLIDHCWYYPRDEILGHYRNHSTNSLCSTQTIIISLPMISRSLCSWYRYIVITWFYLKYPTLYGKERSSGSSPNVLNTQPNTPRTGGEDAMAKYIVIGFLMDARIAFFVLVFFMHAYPNVGLFVILVLLLDHHRFIVPQYDLISILI